MTALNQLTQRFSQLGSDPLAMALKQLAQITRRQGIVLGFGGVTLAAQAPIRGLALAPCWCANRPLTQTHRHIEAGGFCPPAQTAYAPNKVRPLTSLSQGEQNVAPLIHR